MRRRVEVRTALGTCSGPPTGVTGFGQAFDYYLAMGRRPSRYDLSAGRREYEAAVRELQQAMLRFEAAGVPLTTDLGRMMQLWNREQMGAVVEIRDAWIQLVETRRTYERLLRDDAG